VSLKPLKGLSQLIDIRDGEHRSLILAMLFALLAVASAIICRAVSDALFLTTFPLHEVPTFFIVSNLIFFAASMAYSALVGTSRPVRLNTGILALMAASVLLGRVALQVSPSAMTIFSLSVWLMVVAPLMNIVCWITVANTFDSRQGRRLFPIVFGGSTLGAIFAGVVLSPFIGAYGLENLLWALTAMVGLSALIPVLLSHNASRSDAPSRSFLSDGDDGPWKILKEGVTTVGKSKLLMGLAATVFFAGFVTNIVDYAFKGALQASYTKEEIGVFYGYFNAIANTGNLVLQLFVVAWAIDRFGISKIFRVLPLSLMLGTLVLGWIPGFITIVALKLTDGLLRFTFQNSANEVVVSPIPYVDRNRAKVFIRGAMNPAGAIVAGLVLIPFASLNELPLPYLVGGLLGVLLVWHLFAGRIGKLYADQLYTSLRQKQAQNTPSPEEGELFGARSYSDRLGLVTSGTQWESLSRQDEWSLRRRVAVAPPPHLSEMPLGEDSQGWNPDVDPSRGLSDPSPVVRGRTLESLASRVRRGEEVPVGSALIEGLLWREINLAFALLCQRHLAGDVGGKAARRLLELLGERFDETLYRIFLLVGLYSDLHMARTAYFGYRAELGRTRAHAVDLMDAVLDGTPFQRAITLLLEDLNLEGRLQRATHQGIIDSTVLDDPRGVLDGEHDPQLHHLLSHSTLSER